MLQEHAGVVALGLLIGAFLGYLLYEVLNPLPAARAVASAVHQNPQAGVSWNANPHPECRTATWPDIPEKCLTRSRGSKAG